MPLRADESELTLKDLKSEETSLVVNSSKCAPPPNVVDRSFFLFV
jgi:hypothetical protein